MLQVWWVVAASSAWLMFTRMTSLATVACVCCMAVFAAAVWFASTGTQVRDMRARAARETRRLSDWLST